MLTMVSELRAIGHYSTEEAARLAGVSPRRLGRWRQIGIIPATGRRRGTYSYADVAEAVLAHYLTDQGLRPRDVVTLVSNLRQNYGTWPLTSAPLEHEGRLVVIREGGEVYFDALHHVGQRVIEATLNLREVRDALAHGGWVALDQRRDLVEVDPFRLSGLPTIRGRRIPTVLVAELAADPDGLALLREEYGLTRREIDEAVDYEADVRKAIAA